MSKKKLALFTAKFILMAGILAFLLYRASRGDAFETLATQPKQWSWLIGAWLVCMMAVMTTLSRWYLLLRAVGIECTWSEALRFGFVGFLFNLAPMGIVGGDAIKAFMIGRRHDRQYSKALAATFVDRALGLYILFLVALVAIHLTGFHQMENPWGARVHMIMAALAVAGTVGFAVILAPDLSGGATKRKIEQIPLVGPPLRKIAESVQQYRRHPWTLLVASGMSVAVHCLFATGVFLIAGGLYDTHPAFSSHFVLSPVSFATGAIPLAYGPFEGVLDQLYPCVPAFTNGVPATELIGQGQGLVIALCYRVICFLIAGVGVAYYLTGRTEIKAGLEEAKHLEEEGAEAVEPLKTPSSE